MACETPKPGSSMTHETAASVFSSSVPQEPDQNVPLSQLFKPKAGSWECSKCYANNDADKTSCVCCGGSKLGHDVTQKEMPVNTANQASFRFGIPSSGTEFSFPTSSKIASGQSDFKFGITPAHTSEPANNNFGTPISNMSTSAATATATTQALFTSSNAGVPKGFSFGLPSTTTSSVTSIFGGEGTSSTKPFSFEQKTTSGAFLFGSSAGGGTEGSASSSTFSFGSNIQTGSNSDSTPPKDTAGNLLTIGRSKFGYEIEPFSPNQSV
jgi:E3 SUMO-protein ligase RanBP2